MGAYEKLVSLYRNIRRQNPSGSNRDVSSNALGLYSEVCGSYLIPATACPYPDIRALRPTVKRTAATVRPSDRHRFLLDPCQIS
jgi:hypothetical protein